MGIVLQPYQPKKNNRQIQIKITLKTLMEWNKDKWKENVIRKIRYQLHILIRITFDLNGWTWDRQINFKEKNGLVPCTQNNQSSTSSQIRNFKSSKKKTFSKLTQAECEVLRKAITLAGRINRKSTWALKKGLSAHKILKNIHSMYLKCVW